MKNFRSTLLYLGIAALIGGYIYFFERGPVKPKDEPKKDKVFENFVADDISDIKIENFGNTLSAQKSPIEIQKDSKDVWQIISPKNYEADESTLRGLLSNVGGFNPDDTIDHPANLAEFGLNSPTARCTFKTKIGTSFVLLIGDKNATGGSAYIKAENKNTVYLVPGYSTDSLLKDVNDFRNKNFFKTDIVTAQKILVFRDGKSVVFEKEKGNKWQITQPLLAQADESKIRDLLNNISSLRIEKFVEDHPSNLKKYGLSIPRAKVEIWPSGDGKPNGILFGIKKPKGAGFYAKDMDSTTVGLVGDYFDKDMDIKISDYRDKTIMQFDGGGVKAITVKHGENVIVYQKDDKGAWTSPGRPNAGTEAASLVNQLAGTTIADFLTEKVDTGLSSSPFVVDISLTDGTSRVFRFGKRVKDQVYLASDKNKDIYLVPATVVSQMETYYSTVLTPIATQPQVNPSH